MPGLNEKAQGLSDVLRGILERVEAAFPDQAHRIWEVWEDAVGPDIARRARPVAFRSGVLHVGVASSPWMHQLTFLRERIRDELNRRLGSPVVRLVRFRHAPEGTEPGPRPRERADDPAPWAAVHLPGDVRDRVERTSAQVRDAPLREAIRRAWTRAEQLRLLREGRAAAPPRGSTAAPGREGSEEP